MFRFLLSAASIFVLLSATLLFPGAISARRCGERMPTTLLSLYRSSQFIYVGTFDKLEEGEPAEDTDEYTLVPIKKHYTVSSSLKGESRKLLALDDSDYRYKPQQPQVVVEEVVETVESSFTSPEAADTAESSDTTAEAADTAEEQTSEAGEDEEGIVVDSEDPDGGDGESEIKPGDSVLLFLNKDEDGGALVLSDDRDGIKKMTPDRLSAYESRIRELNEIFASPEPSYGAIIAWLVKCAEDPLTRWEGTFELLQSFQNMDWQEERAKEAATKPANESGEEEQYTPELPKKFDTGDVNFAKELTEGQKLLLSNILLTRERPKRTSKAEETSSVVHGDRELIELVKRWGDSKVAANLIEQLRYDASDPGLTAELMSSIATILDDEELSAVASVYSGVMWQSDDDPVEEEDDATNEPATHNMESTDGAAVEASQQVVSAEVTEAAAESSNDAAATATPGKDQQKKKTYGEFRAELLRDFLDRADKLMAEENGGKADTEN